MRKKTTKTKTHPLPALPESIHVVRSVNLNIVWFVGSAFCGFLLVFAILQTAGFGKKNTIKVENNKVKNESPVIDSLIVDPYDLIRMISQKKHMVILDVRSPDEYKKSHIAGAVLFSEKLHIEKSSPIVLYGRTQYSQETVNIARQMTRKGFDAHILAIGWNEFRHFKNLWVPEFEWDHYNINAFIEPRN